LALALNEAKARNTRPRPKASRPRPRPEVSRPRPENLASRPRPNNPAQDITAVAFPTKPAMPLPETFDFNDVL